MQDKTETMIERTMTQNDSITKYMPVAKAGFVEAEPDFAVQLREDLPESDVRQILTLFTLDLDNLLAAITAAAIEGNVRSLRDAAHALAGASGSVGAFLLCAACRAAMTDLASDIDSLKTHQMAIETASQHTRLALTRAGAG